MLGLLLIGILDVCADSSVYRNFNVGGVDLEDKSSMLMPSGANPIFDISAALLDGPMTDYLAESRVEDKKTVSKEKAKKPRKSKESTDTYEEDAQSSVSSGSKLRAKDDDDSD